MKNISLNVLLSKEKANRVLTFILTFVFIYSVLFTTLVTKRYNLKEGDIARSDIKAPREVKDQISTEARIQQAVDSVPIQYSKKTEVKTDTVNKINSFFTRVSQIKDTSGDEKDKIQALKSGSEISLSDDDYLTLIKLNKEDIKTLENFLDKTMVDLYDNNNISDNSQKDNIDDIKKAQENILFTVNSSKISKSLKDVAVSIAYSQVAPNFFYDKEKTEELKNEAIKKVPPIMIKKDQIIVKEGEPITKYQIELLKDLGLLNDNSHFQWYIYISLSILILLVISVEWFYLYKYHEQVYNDTNTLMMINILSCISVLLARIFSVVSPFLIPLACVPMLFTLLVNHKISLTINVLNCILIAGAVDFNIEIIILATLNAVVGAIILKKMQQRNDILYSSLYIAIINVIFTFSVGFLLSNSIGDVTKRASYACVASILSGVLTIGLLPFLESTFDIVTTIKLLELSNPNNPLLKRLLIEAPGSYHHSILVGNLAEVAAEEVGGNPVLARVSAYYHDIGKIKRPYFFKENQLGNDNPHDKITANLSTLIITSHVKDGVDLSREYKIPKVIRDIIEQHHGKTLVKYFYVTAKNSSKNPESINEEEFRYPGPIPETKEAGIMMLADSVEAAVRSISDPTKSKIEEMVNNIIRDRLNEGQLDNCDLTLKDINKIKQAFFKVLTGIYHQRIEYPEEKPKNSNV
ncbi:HD family phosphohydrolase [Clostridiaceae bacterium UIB06]|uniref:HD family phosphohydrolase n=1 Tax=Clostridium thailandense TaxID=2794346 RepID=A0A949TV69_9CLOT|nr:HD family phosphohydrolase [Clostridium thailandense]MBV7273023.1 HD family phosphohydrolase [Clostridium thailandense]MCH5135687.1 HD family phosphohydrolase [Clostridiaceae bacterium UIB06]